MNRAVEVSGLGKMTADSRQPLITELEIRHCVARLAQQVAERYRGRRLIVVVVLKGAFIFAADLLRRLSDLGVGPEVDFVRAASYGSGDRSGGKVKLLLDATIPLEGRDVLLVDDILDSGRTLARLKKHLEARGAASVAVCVLLDKPSRREVDFKPDWVGFEIPDRFVVGYGLDYDERHRTLPYIIAVDTGSGVEVTGRRV